MILVYCFSIVFLTGLTFLLARKKRGGEKDIVLLVFSSVLFSFLTTYMTYLNFAVLNDIQLCIYSFLLVDSLYLYKVHKGNKTAFLFFLKMFSLFMILELCLFNYRHYESLRYKSFTVTNIDAISQTEKKGDLSFTTSHVTNKNREYTLEIKGIDRKIKNIYINASYAFHSRKKMEVTLSATDEANENYFHLPTRMLVPNVRETKYMRLHLRGKTNKLKLTFASPKEEVREDAILQIHEITLNKPVPLSLYLIRPFFLAFVFTLIFLFLPSSKWWKVQLNFKDKTQKKVILGIVFLEILYLTCTVFSNSLWLSNKADAAQLEYHHLAYALKQGQFHLDIPVPETLKKMNNPYDREARRRAFAGTGEHYLWDYAYYNEKYYVYFGVVPALLVYIPASFVCGDFAFPNFLYIYLFGVLTLVATYLLLKEVVSRYFKKIPLLLFLLLWLFAVNAIQLPYIFHRAEFYSIPIITALFFTIMGLYLWLSSTRGDKLNTKRMVVGSICMALVAGCRPQFLVGSFFCFPIFYDTWKRKEILSKKSFKTTILFCLPYILVGICLMYYNYARFGSVFDFGANYNLTTNDMTKRGFVFARIPLGLYTYLFEPLRLTTAFPFMEPSGIDTQYLGRTISERFLGGAMSVHILLLFSLFLPKFKAYFKNKRLYQVAMMSNIFALLILVMDTQMAGILPRYLADFMWLLVISTLLIIASIYSTIREEKLKYVLRFLVTTGVLVTLVYSFFLVFVDISYSMCNNSPYLFYKLYHIFMFFL